MEKIKNFIKENKGLSALLGLAIILLVIIILIFVQFAKENGNGKYGNRLEGIGKVNISSNKIKKVEKEIKEKDEVLKASLRVQGKIVYVNIEFKKSTELDRAKEISNEVLDSFDEDIKKYYDFSCFLIEEDDKNDETVEFAVSGNKHHDFDEYTYIKS